MSYNFILFFCSVLLVSLAFTVFFCLQTYFEFYENEKPLDIVITWVMSDNEFEKEREKWLHEENYKFIINDDHKRYSDHKEVLYCLRSIEKHFPYINNVFLVVKDGQFPNYLKRDHPKLKVINHSDIIPKEYLPTFNSVAIEAYLHHIPELSENYLYFNDDVMLLKDLKPSYFFSNSIPICLHDGPTYSYNKNIYSIDIDAYDFNSGLVFNHLLLDDITKKEPRYHLPHVPKAFKKSYDINIEKRLKNYFINDSKVNIYDETGRSKFRKNKNIYLVSALKYYLYKNWFKCEFKEASSLFLELDDHNKMLDKPQNMTKHFLCIQEVGNNNINKYYTFMDKLYPEKSSFEY